MRSEIFNRIRQNKMKFYAELNNSKKAGSLKYNEATITENQNEKKETVFNKDVINEKPAKKNVVIKKLQEINYKLLIQKAPEIIKTGYQGTVKSKAMCALKSQIKHDQERIKELAVKMNEKLDRQTDKLANGIYGISSVLFEDQPESETSQIYSGGTIALDSTADNSVEWDIDISENKDYSVLDRLSQASERTFGLIRSVPKKIMNFLTTDDLIESNDAYLVGRKF